MSSPIAASTGFAAIASHYPLGPLNGAVPPAPDWFKQALRIEPERGFFESDGIPIELLTWGEVGKPGILFLHGYANHADSWRFIAPYFMRGYRCAAISFSGMGRSGHRPGGYYEYGKLAVEAVDAIGHAQLGASGRRPVCVAHSMGGLVAAIAAAQFDRFEGLIPIDTWFRHIAVPAEQRKPTRMGHLNRLYPDIAEALARYRLSPDQNCENLYVLDFLARQSLRPEGERWRWRLDSKFTTDLRLCWKPELLSDVVCKMAYIYGERSSLIVPHFAGIMGILPPNSAVTGIPEADHNILADQPLALIATLRAILAGWHAESGS